jgi:hypothetical protein
LLGLRSIGAASVIPRRRFRATQSCGEIHLAAPIEEPP